MKNPSDKYPIVFIEWTDSYGSNEWLDEEGIDMNHLDRKRLLVLNVGWLVRKNKDVYVLSPMLNNEDGQWGHVQTIPKAWCKITELAPPKKKG